LYSVYFRGIVLLQAHSSNLSAHHPTEVDGRGETRKVAEIAPLMEASGSKSSSFSVLSTLLNITTGEAAIAKENQSSHICVPDRF
jgi:hypothetical protein